MSKRLFIGIKVRPSEKLLSVFQKLKIKFKSEKINWVVLENLHITLKYLGKTDSKQISTICNELKLIATKTKPFKLKIKNLWHFVKNKKTKVIWAGVDKSIALQSISDTIVTSLQQFGFEKEKRPFTAHLTLGKVKHISDEESLNKILQNYKDVVFQDIDIENFTLFESILEPNGTVYKTIEQFEFLIDD